ncbi:hypothetical protein TNCV_490121 [Trichonephila clavipes]|nr:hypothetical protein TNCV_490121 [Trichonephila clavipes]
MVCLEEIAAIANILKTAPASTVELLRKIVNDEPYKMRKTVKINGYDFDALIDAGSTITLICAKVLSNSWKTDDKSYENKTNFFRIAWFMFSFLFGVVSSFSGWPIVKWMALRSTSSPPSINLPGSFERKREGNDSDRRGSERRDMRTRDRRR